MTEFDDRQRFPVGRALRVRAQYEAVSDHGASLNSTSKPDARRMSVMILTSSQVALHGQCSVVVVPSSSV